MTEDLVSKYYNVEELDRLLEGLAMATGFILTDSTRQCSNENWAKEELVENMIEADHQLTKRFCDILIRKDLEVSAKAGDKTREIYGI